jgi:hypothetical protein
MVTPLGLNPVFHKFASQCVDQRQKAVIRRRRQLVLGEKVGEVASECLAKFTAVHTPSGLLTNFGLKKLNISHTLKIIVSLLMTRFKRHGSNLSTGKLNTHGVPLFFPVFTDE